MGRVPPLSRGTLLVAVLLGGAPGRGALAQSPPMPTPEQRSCDLHATRGYCIGMTAMTPGIDDMLASCAADGGTVLDVCPDDDTIAWCVLPTAGAFHMRTYHYTGLGPQRWTVARAREACARAGGELQLPPE